MPLETYNEQSELEEIELRYSNVQRCIPYTLKHLQQSPLFLSVVEQVKSEGWKDWHILQALFNGVLSWYSERSGAIRDVQRAESEGRALFQRFFEQGETPNDPSIPPEYFNLETMHMLLNLGIMTFLSKKGAVFGQRGYEPERMRKIVRDRYHYFELDVEHSPVFNT